jgi:hypothetical protein
MCDVNKRVDSRSSAFPRLIIIYRALGLRALYSGIQEEANSIGLDMSRDIFSHWRFIAWKIQASFLFKKEFLIGFTKGRSTSGHKY